MSSFPDGPKNIMKGQHCCLLKEMNVLHASDGAENDHEGKTLSFIDNIYISHCLLCAMRYAAGSPGKCGWVRPAVSRSGEVQLKLQSLHNHVSVGISIS